MKILNEIVQKETHRLLKEEYFRQDLLKEGIIPNYIKKSVKLTMDNNDGVDFSEDSYIKFKANGLTVYSIFRRTPLPEFKNNENDSDGNPFIYALKGIDGWRFDVTDTEIVQYIKRFLSICHTIDKHYDVVVMAPSKSDVNKRFMKVIYSIVGAAVKIEDYFLKVRTSEILYNLDTEMIEKDYPAESLQNYLEIDMKKYLGRMGTYFDAKNFPKQYLKYIKSIVDVDNKYSVADSNNLFKGKKVLVLDDIFSSGKTVSDCANCIWDFSPRKVDVITLLSRKMHV